MSTPHISASTGMTPQCQTGRKKKMEALLQSLQAGAAIYNPLSGQRSKFFFFFFPGEIVCAAGSAAQTQTDFGLPGKKKKNWTHPSEKTGCFQELQASVVRLEIVRRHYVRIPTLAERNKLETDTYIY